MCQLADSTSKDSEIPLQIGNMSQLRGCCSNLDDSVPHVRSEPRVLPAQDVQLSGVAPIEKKVQRLRSILQALDNVETAFDTAFLQPLGDFPTSFGELIHVVEADEGAYSISKDRDTCTGTKEESRTQGSLLSSHVARSGSCKM